jgi:alkylation response protein AidB-like acyl-CoA dehydrogenase
MTAEPASVGVELPVGAIEEFFSARAKAVDSGDADLRAGLRYLAELGLLAHPELQVSCDVVTAVARCCLASAFSVWAHTMVAEYLSMSASPRLQSQVPRLRDAAVIGSTAMAPAMQNLVGLADLGVRFTRNDDVLVVDGAVRWASNLFADGFLVVFGAAGGDGGERVIVAVPSDAPGVVAGPPLGLLALGATCSSNVTFDKVRVGPEWVVSTQFETYLRAVKPRFLLLQSSFCIGLAQAAVACARSGLGRSFDVFQAEHDRFTAALGLIEARQRRLVGSLGPARSVVEHRLEAAETAQAAVALELRVTGGGGYRAPSPTARRVREAAFLPIQSPTEGHLRWELARAHRAGDAPVTSSAR